MKSLREVPVNQLPVWVQPFLLRPTFELRAGKELFGRVRWGGVLHAAVTGESQEGKWSSHHSWFARRFEIEERAPDTRRLVFNFTDGFYGQLVLPEGPTYRWVQVDYKGYEWAWNDEWGEQLLYLKHGRKFRFKRKAELVIKPNARSLPDLPLLATLGWHLMARQFVWRWMDYLVQES